MADKEKLREIAKVYTVSLFNDMQNPAYRGPNFTWEGFPEMAARLASTSAFMYFSDAKTPTAEDEAFVARVAKQLAARLVKQQNCKTCNGTGQLGPPHVQGWAECWDCQENTGETDDGSD